VTDHQLSPLLELDPDLGQLLDAERLASAREELLVAVHPLQPGPWDIDKLSGASPEHIGLLLVDGILARDVLVWDTVSTELLGSGDVVRPWRLNDGGTLLRHAVRWNVLTRTRVALLDRRVATRLLRYPEVNAVIIDRVVQRSLRLSITQAISQLNRVDRRLLALFWHLAERWGRMTADGVVVPMTLPHRVLGQLIGARRPTVSTAISDLGKAGELVRRDDGTWLLTGGPVGVPAPEVEKVIPMRRRLVPPDKAPRPQLEPVQLNGSELPAVLQRLREQTAIQLETMRATYDTTTELYRRTADLRERSRIVRNGGA
jgi:CRP/FNR family transcriptional regulator, cyclic AMP receptor protein